MKTWEEELEDLFDQNYDIDSRKLSKYDFRPGKLGLIMYCDICGRAISTDLNPNLEDLVEEAKTHERLNH